MISTIRLFVSVRLKSLQAIVYNRTNFVKKRRNVCDMRAYLMVCGEDIRENPKVRYIGSHAALTCHIAVMRHVITGVVSVGHFDNFCCWQYGQDSSAHKDGIKLMLEEIGGKV